MGWTRSVTDRLQKDPIFVHRALHYHQTYSNSYFQVLAYWKFNSITFISSPGAPPHYPGY